VAETGERTEVLKLCATITRIVALGDPHGDLLGLVEVLSREERPENAIVSVGDNVGYADAVASSALCQLLAEKRIPSVLGNHEAWSQGGQLFLAPPGEARKLTDAAAEWCRALPHRLRIEAAHAPELSLSVVHTLPDWAYVNADNAERLASLEDVDVTFCGHSHCPTIYALKKGQGVKVRRLDPDRDVPVKVVMAPGTRYVVDAGSLARPSRARSRPSHERGSYAALDLETRTLRLYSFDKKKRLQELLQQEIDENTRAARKRAAGGAS
jgi:predicted phosphodiesterase